MLPSQALVAVPALLPRPARALSASVYLTSALMLPRMAAHSLSTHLGHSHFACRSPSHGLPLRPLGKQRLSQRCQSSCIFSSLVLVLTWYEAPTARHRTRSLQAQKAFHPGISVAITAPTGDCPSSHTEVGAKARSSRGSEEKSVEAVMAVLRIRPLLRPTCLYESFRCGRTAPESETPKTRSVPPPLPAQRHLGSCQLSRCCCR